MAISASDQGFTKVNFVTITVLAALIRLFQLGQVKQIRTFNAIFRSYVLHLMIVMGN